MSYRLDPRESLPESIRRIVGEQLDGAIDGLRTAQDGDRDAAVHDVRKRLKKSRAVLRLVRDEVGSKTYRRDNRALRDVGRGLSAPRDAAVLVEAVDRLERGVPLARRSLAPLREELERRRAETSRRVLEENGTMDVAATGIGRVHERVEDWRIGENGFAALEDGLLHTYRCGQARFDKAREDPTDERMHEARKRVKDLWYHARILEPVWQQPMDVLVEALDLLGDRLGEDHDLAVLTGTVQALEREDADGGAAETVTNLARTRRQELRTEIWPLGRRIYADRPKAFVRRMRTVYHVWRDEQTWSLSPASADRVRALLAAREDGSVADQRRARERLRRYDGIRIGDLDELCTCAKDALPRHTSSSSSSRGGYGSPSREPRFCKCSGARAASGRFATWPRRETRIR